MVEVFLNNGHSVHLPKGGSAKFKFVAQEGARDSVLMLVVSDESGAQVAQFIPKSLDGYYVYGTNEESPIYR